MQQYKINLKENKEQLINIFNELSKKVYSDKKVEKILRKFPSATGMYSKGALFRTYAKLKNSLKLSKTENETLLKNIQMKKIRSSSGVTPVTVLTKPFPCPGKCIFCPNDVRMPKSYLRDEPGAQRAESNFFDPYLQTHNRLAALKNIGHPIDKIELIILGGTWSSYPLEYQIWFVKRCFDALNDFDGTEQDLIKPNVEKPTDENKLEEIKGEKLDHSYNQVISLALNRQKQLTEKTTWKELETAHLKNVSAKQKCVGLVIETRPDEINKEEVLRLRKLGATKIQIGIQSLNDKVLKLNKRGHDVAQTALAFNLLRQAGFKIQGHYMPNLYGSSPTKDISDYKKLFTNLAFKPDELKVYPCSLIESAELMQYYKKGLWKPYNEKDLYKVLTNAYAVTPRYCRINRMIRDIPSTDIVVGNHKTNFRQMVDKELSEKGIKIVEMRHREIRSKKIENAKIKVTSYKTNGSTEKFIEFVTEKDELIGFLRLSLPNTPKNLITEELNNCAIIREVHVYGQSLGFGKTNTKDAQHTGFGKKLIKKAEEISKKEGYKKLAVISAIGTREYYKKLGYELEEMYQIKKYKLHILGLNT